MKVDVTKKTVELYAHERAALVKAQAILTVLSPHIDDKMDGDHDACCVAAGIADVLELFPEKVKAVAPNPKVNDD